MKILARGICLLLVGAAVSRGQTVTYPLVETSTVFDGDSFGNAEITLADGRVYFTVDTPTATDGQFIYWLGTAPTTKNWQVSLDVHLATAASLGVASEQSVYASLIVYRTGDSLTYTGNQPDFHGSYASVARNAALTPNDILVGSNYRPGVSVFGANVASASTDVSLRVGFNGSTKGMTVFYDANGATGGYSFTSLNASVDTDAPATTWLMGPNDTFSFAILLQTTGVPVDFGALYVENFRTSGLSAIPEPSAGAALAGLGMLGLAFWRRSVRQRLIASRHP